MKRRTTVFGVKLMGVILLLLLTACGSKDDVPPSQPDDLPEQTDVQKAEEPAAPEPEEAAAPQMEETEWEVTSENIGELDLSGGIENPDFEYIFNHTDTVPLDRLVAFSLVADGLSEGAHDEIYHRFLEAPHKVLTYLTSISDQFFDWNTPDRESTPESEMVCWFIATTDAVQYGGTEEFTQTVSACREAYPDGPIAELLDILELDHTAALAQHS